MNGQEHGNLRSQQQALRGTRVSFRIWATSKALPLDQKALTHAIRPLLFQHIAGGGDAFLRADV
jgi:hypothetical protein